MSPLAQPVVAALVSDDGQGLSQLFRVLAPGLGVTARADVRLLGLGVELVLRDLEPLALRFLMVVVEARGRGRGTDEGTPGALDRGEGRGLG